MKSISDTKKPRAKKRGPGRPTTGIGETIGLRLYPDLEARLDRWIKKQPEPKPSKPAAIRALLSKALDE